MRTRCAGSAREKTSVGKRREQKAINAVACPWCHAERGEPCLDKRTGLPRLEYGRPMICPDRRTAWQMIRDGEITDAKG